jgi:hypothetical protein
VYEQLFAVAVNGMTRACSSVEWLIPLVCLSVRARATCNSIVTSCANELFDRIDENFHDFDTLGY